MHGFIGLVPRNDLGCDGKARGDHGLFAQNRQFFHDKADVAVAIDQFFNLGERFFAVAAAVVHKLYDGHVAFGIATDIGIAVVEDRSRIVGHQREIRLRLCFGLTGLQLVHRFHDHFGVFHQIGADLGAELRAFGIGQFGQVHRMGGGCQGKGH